MQYDTAGRLTLCSMIPQNSYKKKILCADSRSRSRLPLICNICVKGKGYYIFPNYFRVEGNMRISIYLCWDERIYLQRLFLENIHKHFYSTTYM